MLILVLLTGCGDTSSAGKNTYEQITQEAAKEMMDTMDDAIVLDVREQDEFDAGHIPGAIFIPDNRIDADAEKVLTDKNQLILVYCRSGNRSKTASAALAELGYTEVYEFGGINTWPYEVE